MQEGGKRTNARKIELGQRAERLAADHLVEQGFSVLDRNVRVGRLEIDLIAQKGDLLVFCEVRSRSCDRWVAPHHSIDTAKADRIRRAAAQWIRDHPQMRSFGVRLDVAAVVDDGRGAAQLTYYDGAL